MGALSPPVSSMSEDWGGGEGVEPATQTGIGRGDPGASETLKVK